MVLTRSFVRATRPCTEGFRRFIRQLREGGDNPDQLDATGMAGPARITRGARGMT